MAGGATAQRYWATATQDNSIRYIQYRHERDVSLLAADVSSEPAVLSGLTEYVFRLDDPSDKGEIQRRLKTQAALTTTGGEEKGTGTNSKSDLPVGLRILWLGASDSGKTVMMERLKSPNATTDILRSIKHTQATTTHELPPFDLFGRTVYPTIVDHAGENSGSQIESIAKKVEKSARWWGRQTGTPAKAHTIWILTLAPCMAGDSEMPSTNAIDYEYVGLQRATINISVGLLGLPGIDSPTGILVCITKFGQVSASRPAENPATVAQMQNLFGGHLDTITTVAGSRNIPVRVVITDALRDWGAPSLRIALQDLMFQTD